MKIIFNIAVFCISFFAPSRQFNETVPSQRNRLIEIIFVYQPHAGSLHFRIINNQASFYIQTPKRSGIDSLSHLLSADQSEAYYSAVQALRLDTLSNYYDGGGFDGYDMLIKYKIDSAVENSIGVHNIKLEVIKSLLIETNRLASDSRFHFQY